MTTLLTARLTPRFDDALAYASALHRGQVRKGSGIPYVSHLLAVAALVLEAGGDEEQAIAGLLHDAVEDCGGLPRLAEIRARYGDRVADIVWACTDSHEEPKPEWRARKEAYVAGMAAKPADALLVSLADKTHNLSAIARDHAAIGDAVWDRFTGGRDGTLWYYSTLAATFEGVLPGQAAEAFSAGVARLVAAAG
jgi:(p)ppGpp synthase/HD superfamily hydrolase